MSYPLSKVGGMRITPREVRSKLTEEQREVLVGTLLGDGCLAQHGRFHRLHVKHRSAHEVLAEFKYEVFRDFISMPLHHFSQRLGSEEFPCVQFATRTSPVFSEWHSRFYVDRRKTVPSEIGKDLSPLALAVWLMDDGSADYAGLTIQTHSFCSEEVQRLAEVLQSKFGLATNMRRNKGAEVIYLRAESIPRLRKIVGPFILPEFGYKLIPRRERTP